MASPFDPLEALAYLDFSRTYDKFSSTIDLIIFFMLFMGLSKVTIGKRFEGKGGNLICIAVSAMLSMGLLLLEQTTSFNLRSFGGIAILAVFAIIAVFLFMMFRAFNADLPLSISLTYITLFFGLNAVSPEIFIWFIKKFPTIHLVLLLLFLATAVIVIRKTFMLLFKGFKLPGRVPNTNISNDNIVTEAIDLPGKQELKEEKTATKQLKKETKLELKEAKTIIHILEMIIKTLQHEGVTNVNKQKMMDALTKILYAEHDIEAHMKQQQDMILKLESATDKDIKAVIAEFKRMQGLAVNRLKEFRFRLKLGSNSINGNQTEIAIDNLNQARVHERKLKSLLKVLKKLEGKILRLIKKDVRKNKKAEKTKN